MNSLFFICFAAISIACASGLKCHNCIQKKGDESTLCEKKEDYEEKTTECKKATDEEFACAKFVKKDDDGEIDVLIRNCIAKSDFDVDWNWNEALDKTCQFGLDHSFNKTKYFAGTLCLCKDDLCNSSSNLSFKVVLIPFILLVKLFI